MKDITFLEQNYNFPESWNECTDAQLLFLAKTYLMNIQNFYTENEAGEMEPVSKDLLIQLDYSIFLGLINFPQSKINHITEFDLGEMHRYLYDAEILNFVKHERNLTRNPFPKIKNFIGPQDDFLDMEAEEFFTAQTQLYENLDLFMAAIYRKKDSKGKEPFSFQCINKNLKEIQSIAPEYKVLLRLYFESNVSELEENNSEAFEGKPSDGDHYEMLLNIANEGTFGNFNEVKKTNVNLLFKEICRVVKEGKKLESLYKK